MKVRDLMNKLQDLAPDTLVCVAEVDEAFAVNISEVEVVDGAKTMNAEADGREAVELANGSEQVVVIRW
ncbi:sugar phosphorylase [Chelativorans sp.]|uniref:sugar phosphorylase n=1 Tax=Chelativorans sp. TaxID=2203393 RepID=UPI002811E764|nr:sugar phosphorylase [Chelativorans sp.]